MSGYENAPATLMVASNCACCGKDLVDSVSVETGVGPDCRKKHGFTKAQGEMDAEEAWPLAYDVPAAGKAIVEGDARKAANILTHKIAMAQNGPQVSKWVQAISLCGFAKLADRIAKRVGRIEITVEGNLLAVKAPYNESFLSAVRSVPGQYWDQARKVRMVPVRSEAQLMLALQRVYGDVLVSKGSILLALSA